MLSCTWRVKEKGGRDDFQLSRLCDSLGLNERRPSPQLFTFSAHRHSAL